MKKAHVFFLTLLSLNIPALAHEGNMFNVTTAGKTFNITTNVPNHTYPAAGIKMNTSGYQITSGCTMAASGYCLFAVSDTQPAAVSFSGSGGTVEVDLCLNGNGPLSCQQFTQQVSDRFLYVTNLFATGADSVQACSIQSDGTLSNCIPAGNTQNYFVDPASISINADNTLAYVVNYDGESIVVCPINPDGTFADCNPPFPFSFSYGGSVISPDGQNLFVTNYNTKTVDACPIDSNGLLGTCVDTGAAGIHHPYGIILNKAGTVAYVAGLLDINSVAYCTVSGTTFSCSPSGSADAGPLGLAFSADESQVYIANTNGGQFSVQVCDVGGGGTLGCLDTGYGSDAEPWGITVDGLNAYVSNPFENAIQLCTITTDPLNKGQFTSCIDSGAGGNFDGPVMMSLSN